MTESSVKVGDIVHAGDLVTVQHGTKYFDLTYWHGNSLDEDKPNVDYQSKTVVKKAYEIFDANSADAPSFKYWKFYDIECSADMPVDVVLTSDANMFGHYNNQIAVNYIGNGGIYGSTMTSYSEVSSNEVYYDIVNDQVQKLSSYVSWKLSDNKFVRDTYRFARWKTANNDTYQAGSEMLINCNTDVSADWIQQFQLNIVNSPNGVIHTSIQQSTTGLHDDGTVVIAYGYPNPHYHLDHWTVFQASSQYYGPKFNSYSSRIMQFAFQLTANTDISAAFIPDICKLNIIIDTPNSAKVTFRTYGEHKINDVMFENSSYDIEYGVNFVAVAEVNDGYRFVAWTGDVPTSIRPTSLAVSTRIISDVMTLRAVTSALKAYAIVGRFNIVGAGKISSSKATYYEGQDAQLTVVANIGYEFVSWMTQTSKPITSEEYPNVHVVGNVLKVIDIQCSMTFNAMFVAGLLDENDQPIVTDSDEAIDDCDMTL